MSPETTSGRVAVITGASSGIQALGHALVRPTGQAV
jgi:NADP-dependent 3-hydroxy acid dehydrogenase YdfG